jgi:hypothetical protein
MGALPRAAGSSVFAAVRRPADPVSALRLRLLGVGAMNSPTYAPAGLVVSYQGSRVMLDGGPGAEPSRGIDAWLVTDSRAELIREIRALARVRRRAPRMGGFRSRALTIRARPVAHTSHPTVGYIIVAGGRRVVWAPEFWEFPPWASSADLMFADAAGWNRAIRFAHGAGGHACVFDVARAARHAHVRRLVFAHIGRPSIRARERGEEPPFGEWGVEGRTYVLSPSRGGSA